MAVDNRDYLNVIERKIIGIITQTDQFVPTHPHTLEDTHGDGLIPYDLHINILDANKRIWENKKEDPERIEMVQRIRLETNFYNSFRANKVDCVRRH